MLTYKIIRSRRKTVAIIVSARGEVTVRAPLRASRAAIEAFVNDKQGWIHDRLVEVSKRQSQSPAHRFAAGEVFPFQGRFYPLELVESERPALELTGGAFRLAKAWHKQAGKTFANWYRAQARILVQARVEYFARVNGFNYKMLRISSARTRWGSCSSRGTLSFSWRVAALPPEVLDYVVVHELCHLRQPNHSPAFWTEVERVQHDFRQQRKALAGWGQHTLWD